MADQQTPAETQLRLEKLYIKSFSFKSPQAPEIFHANVDTQIQLNVRSASRPVDADTVEVTVTLTLESLAQEETVFRAELVQAGLFVIRGYTSEQRFTLLGTYCPGSLYPYAREAIADLVEKSGFPQLLLQPLDFDTLFAQTMQAGAVQRQDSLGDPAAAGKETQ